LNTNQNNSSSNNISQDESAMNFSFSEVKTSQDKFAGPFFEKNMVILQTDYPNGKNCCYEMME
jgi:hypothetical protein